MREENLLLKLKKYVLSERSKCKSARGVNYSRKTIELAHRILQETDYTHKEIHEVTDLSHDFLRRQTRCLKSVSGFMPVKIVSERVIAQSSFYEVETAGGMKVHGLNLEDICFLEQRLRCI